MENFEDTFDDELTSLPEQEMQDAPEATVDADQACDSQAPVPEGKKKERRGLRAVVAAILALAMVAGGCGITYQAVNSGWEKKAAADATAIAQLNQKIEDLQYKVNVSHYRTDGTIVAGNLVSTDGTMTPRQVYADNNASVVAISSSVTSTSPYTGQTSRGTSTGSGFIITEDGYIVTNYHVIENATEVKVITSFRMEETSASSFAAKDTEEYTAKVVGYDAANDVAVLKIEATGLPAVTLGSSDQLYIGDMVCAIGNPLGSLTATLTVGYVSGKDRQISTDSTMINMIQTDAAINSGNSGGPLFNMYGEVVGITSAKYSGTTSSGASIEGISFAIPIDDVMSIIGDLRNFGYVTGAYLGVTVQDTDASAAKLYGMPTGAYVASVVKDGAADQAGIREKDIIIGLGDYDVSSVNELTRTLRRFKAGDTTTVTVIRSGERLTLDINLDEKPKDLNAKTTTPEKEQSRPENGNYDEWYKYFFGEDGNGSKNGK